jgi:hypothetical protein
MNAEVAKGAKERFAEQPQGGLALLFNVKPETNNVKQGFPANDSL